MAPERLEAAAAAISGYLLEHARLANSAGGACQAEIESLRARREHVLAQVRWRCPPLTGTLVYRVTLFHEVDPAARHMLTVSGDLRRMALLSNTAPEAELVQTRAQVPRGPVALLGLGCAAHRHRTASTSPSSSP